MFVAMVGCPVEAFRPVFDGCLWRRKEYIHAGRLFANRQGWKAAVRDLGTLTEKHLLDAVDVLGKGAGLKEVLANPGVDEKVKRAVRSLLICMSSVVGSNAHRTTLRHMCRSYTNLFGPPLVFTTVNPSDTRSVIVKLMYDGADVAQWRCELGKEALEMLSAQGMNRIVARDPVAMAEFFDLTLKLFLRDVLGVSDTLSADGVASACGVGGVWVGSSDVVPAVCVAFS